MHLHIGETTTQILLGFIPVCGGLVQVCSICLSGAETKRQLPKPWSSYGGSQEHRRPGQTVNTLKVTVCCEFTKIPVAKASHVAKPSINGGRNVLHLCWSELLKSHKESTVWVILLLKGSEKLGTISQPITERPEG